MSPSSIARMVVKNMVEPAARTSLDDEHPFFCICDEEWCWCTNAVAGVDESCDVCKAGHHKNSPFTEDRS